jgi:hypothetical protein
LSVDMSPNDASIPRLDLIVGGGVTFSLWR